MSNLECNAMMGDLKAQEECTKLGIVLPCPICHNPVKVSVSNMLYACVHCHLIMSFSSFHVNPEDTLRIWNARHAPPIVRCKDCKRQGTGDSYICHSGLDEEFCSNLEPKED